MFRRKPACSFCGKSEADVAKLVAGPGVYICDQCAAQAIRIMEASHDDEPRPSPSRGGLWRRVCQRLLRPWRAGLSRSSECWAVPQ